MAWATWLFGLFLSQLSVSRATWVPVNASRTVVIGGHPYYLTTEPVLSLPNIQLPQEIVPFAIFNANTSSVTRASLSSTIASWQEIDDVFNDGFLQGALIRHASYGSAALSSSAIDFLNSKGTELVMLADHVSAFRTNGRFVIAAVGNINLPAGPYVLARDAFGKPAVYAPLRLHFDDSQSFFKSVSPLSDGSFAVVSATMDTDSSPYIGVPSRIYTLQKSDPELPLAGVRVSVKDIYLLKGLRASAGNRHFYTTYPPRNVTGPAVSRLLQLGAQVVGITKTVQFANGDRATADWIDYHAPFDQRNDGYREPSGSSTGAGTSISALDWLDVSIGSDTGGSIRDPAGVNGLFGIRPSVGAISLEDVVPLSDVLDTGGFISRDPKLFAAFGKAWYADSFKSYPSFPHRILLSSDFENVSPSASAIYNAFIEKLQTFLGATTTNFSIQEAWNETSGIKTPVDVLLNQTYALLIGWHQWNAVGKPFFADYAAANQGRKPHVNPGVLIRWNYAQSQGLSAFETELSHREAFENWTLNHFLTENRESCSDSIFMYPQSPGEYVSREMYYSSPNGPPFGFSTADTAVHARLPDLVIPIGQIPFMSNITGIEEQLPVTVSLVARRGCDFVLLDLLNALADADIVHVVKTGRTAF
ncbi:amidase signature enzyme [Dentipellis sp. KUC8613]|nr:amidase signature enzyme [Dentipellis sp. KUC8613]